MPRPHVEYIQVQNVAWNEEETLDLHRGARLKLLNGTDDHTDCTVLIEYPAGARSRSSFYRSGAEEVFVLSGELQLNGVPLKRHHYAYLPAGYFRASLESPAGAVVLTFLTGGHGDLPGARPEATPQVPPPRIIDTAAMEWDGSTIDPRLAHLRLSRKILRISAEEPCRTYLLAGLPHGRPASSRLQLERHEYAEEMFLISGDMASPKASCDRAPISIAPATNSMVRISPTTASSCSCVIPARPVSVPSGPGNTGASPTNLLTIRSFPRIVRRRGERRTEAPTPFRFTPPRELARRFSVPLRRPPLGSLKQGGVVQSHGFVA